MDRDLLERVENQAWFHRYPRGWPFMLFVLASIGTLITVLAIERLDRQRREVELERDFSEIAMSLQRRADENVALLRAGAALFETQENVDARRFSEFLSGLQGDGNHHGSLGMGWTPLVRVPDLAKYERDRRGRGQPGFAVYPRPGPGAQVVVPIVFLEPRTPENRGAVGFDMYSEANRREAIDRSIRLGKPVASGRVQLVQDRHNPAVPGFLIYMPVFTDRTKSQVKGFVYSPFRASQFVGVAADLFRSREVEISVYDGAPQAGSLLFRRDSPGMLGLTVTHPIMVAERKWTLQVRSKTQAALTPLSRLTLIFGAISALLVMAIGQLLTRRAAEDRQVLTLLQSQAVIRDSLTRELHHRVKNTLANVLSIAALTRRRAVDTDEFHENFAARIRALSATHDLLSQSNWRDAPLGEIVRSELAPYMLGDSVLAHLSGPTIYLAPNDAMSLGLAIHELATNAAKYGALTSPEGRIHVEWRQTAPDRATIHWREEGGPQVIDPGRRGFGRDLIEKIVAHELGSRVSLVFAPAGVECELVVPVRRAGEFALRDAMRRERRRSED